MEVMKVVEVMKAMMTLMMAIKIPTSNVVSSNPHQIQITYCTFVVAYANTGGVEIKKTMECKT